MAKGKLLSFFFGNYIVCPFVVFLWPLYCLSSCRFPFGHYSVCPFVVFIWPLYWAKRKRQRKNNIMAKGKRQKDKQCNDQRKRGKRQTI
jgi:hypothetical protein